MDEERNNAEKKGRKKGVEMKRAKEKSKRCDEAKKKNN
jgi:hypothetical protein